MLKGFSSQRTLTPRSQQGSEYPMVKIVMRFLLYARGGRALKKVYEDAPPQGPTPYPFIYLYHF